MRRWPAVLAVLALITFGAVLQSPPAQAKGGEVGGSGNEYYLSDSFSAQANIAFAYGSAGDRTYVGDWNGDGVDTLALRRGNIYHIRNSLSGGAADRQVAYGRTSDVVLVGDWNGDGIDTLVVRRGNIYYFRNSLSSGNADRVVAYGRTSDVVLVGDWNGDGIDTLAVRRGNIYYFINSLSSGNADRVVAYGRTSDRVLIGDWNGDRVDSLAVRRDNLYYIANGFGGGAADRVVAYGRATDAVMVGDWNADGIDTLGIRRPAPAPVQFGAGTLRVGTDVAPGTYRASTGADSCYWERLAGFSGEFDDIIANDFGQRYPIVTISAGDAGFHSTGCGTWNEVRSTYPGSPSSTFSDGAFVVSRHIVAGTYHASGLAGEACYWQRLSGFNGEFSDIIANDFDGSLVVTIAASDAGFSSVGCGRWTRL